MIRRLAVIALLVILAATLMYAVSQLPPHGSADTPAYRHVASRYLERGPEEAGADNIVTDVILNYRGFDTNGEVTVIFTAMAAVLAVLLGTGNSDGSDTTSPGIAPSVVVRYVVRVIAPIIVVFATYVILNGHVTPGGGFQGGTILGALVIMLTLVVDDQTAAHLLPRGPERLLQAAAPLTFFAVGTAGLVFWGSYLQYPGTGAFGWVTEVMLIIVEIGIGVGGAMVIATIFRTMAGPR